MLASTRNSACLLVLLEIKVVLRSAYPGENAARSPPRSCRGVTRQNVGGVDDNGRSRSTQPPAFYATPVDLWSRLGWLPPKRPKEPARERAAWRTASTTASARCWTPRVGVCSTRPWRTRCLSLARCSPASGRPLFRLVKTVSDTSSFGGGTAVVCSAWYLVAQYAVATNITRVSIATHIRSI